MEYNKINDLEEFVKDVDKYLTKNDNLNAVQYPKNMVSPWKSDDLLKTNDSLLSDVSGNANIYVIFTAENNSETYSIKYIGKTKSKLSRERLKNHLIKKHKKTGAKLSKVIAHIKGGGNIKISWVLIQPESLRNYVEEELIAMHPESNWNRENA